MGTWPVFRRSPSAPLTPSLSRSSLAPLLSPVSLALTLVVPLTCAAMLGPPPLSLSLLLHHGFRGTREDQLTTEGRSGSATQVVEWLEKVQFANRETEMNLKNVRMHIRILRRLSLAVENPAAPTYQNSALYYLERNEGMFGRRSPELVVQESARYLGQFQAALPELADLRNAAETWHILNLRGCAPKVGGRQVVEHARALAMYSRVPASLVPRFPRYAPMLEEFLGPKEFHEAFPVRLNFDGTPLSRQQSGVPSFRA